MSGPDEPIATYPPHPCSCGETHHGHICWLSRMGLLHEVAHLSAAPTVRCRQCGARANLPHNVCSPEPLGAAEPTE